LVAVLVASTLIGPVTPKAHAVNAPISTIRSWIFPWYTQADMKPIAGTDANNVGLARNGDILDIICSAFDNRGLEWYLVINRNGRAGLQSGNTVGFVMAYIVVAYTGPIHPSACY
jgi:hypothetical protein